MTKAWQHGIYTVIRNTNVYMYMYVLDVDPVREQVGDSTGPDDPPSEKRQVSVSAFNYDQP